MACEVEILADSISPAGARLTTFKLKFARFLLPQFSTHRAISKSAASHRAIPTAKVIAEVERDPFVPESWGLNRKGMQATEEVTPREAAQCAFMWIEARDRAVRYARAFAKESRVHKQVASRLLEPFAWASVVATATGGGWLNYFALRCADDAQPEHRTLAAMMARAYRDSTPRPVDVWDWHVPFGDDSGCLDGDVWGQLRVSVARCARVSYVGHDGKPVARLADLALADDLQRDGHWSPFEHQAQALIEPTVRSGNLVGWRQYRQTFPNSVHDTFDFSTLDD